MTGHRLGDLSRHPGPPTIADQAEAWCAVLYHVGEVVWFARALALADLDLSTAVVELAHHARQAERAAEAGRLL